MNEQPSPLGVVTVVALIVIAIGVALANVVRGEVRNPPAFGIVLVGFWYIWKKGALDWGLTVPSPQEAKFARADSAGKARL